MTARCSGCCAPGGRARRRSPTQLLAGLILTPPNELSGALAMSAGWVINLAVAEWAIRRLPAQRARSAALAAAHPQ